MDEKNVIYEKQNCSETVPKGGVENEKNDQMLFKRRKIEEDLIAMLKELEFSNGCSISGLKVEICKINDGKNFKTEISLLGSCFFHIQKNMMSGPVFERK